MPTALSTTPTTSNEWACVSNRGTRRHASTKATTPTGTLTKKIHSQPRPSTSTPPSSGPTSVATPAVAPHRLIALPRWSGGNRRVMTAIVCGVMSAAPRPWNARAAMSAPIEPARPHAAEATVNTARPTR